MRKIGYCRVSSSRQNLDRHGCVEVLKRAARTAPCAGGYLQLRLVSNTAMR